MLLRLKSWLLDTALFLSLEPFLFTTGLDSENKKNKEGIHPKLSNYVSPEDRIFIYHLDVEAKVKVLNAFIPLLNKSQLHFSSFQKQLHLLVHQVWHWISLTSTLNRFRLSKSTSWGSNTIWKESLMTSLRHFKN